MNIKTIILGESGVGKTRFLNYIRNEKMISYCPTIGVDFVVYKSKCNVNLQIWDTSGSERFRAVVNNFLIGIDLCIFVYNSKSSFEYIMNKIADVKNNEYGKRFCIVAFKYPLLGQKFASKYGFFFFHVNIQEKEECITVLEDLSRLCLHEQKHCNFLKVNAAKGKRSRETAYCWLSFC